MRDGSWSIAEVARMSKVTSRTLRHYDAIGLLRPAWVADDGRRHYGRPELLRLQRILLLRELDLGLDAVAEVLERQSRAGTVEVLSRYREWLLAERTRLARLARTVERTIDSVERGEEMSAETMFEGFEHNPYEAEARQRWGDEAVDASYQRLRSLGADDAELARTGFDKVHSALKALRDAGVPVGDPRVRELVALHHKVVSLFWTPDAEAYRGLGRMYVEDERYHASIGGAELAAYLRDAIDAHADAVTG